MKKKVVTIKDIAREAQCASSTVSKLLNGGNVREPQRSRILRIIREHDYTPNTLAKGLRRKQSYAVGVVFPEFNNFFTMNIMTTLEAELNKRGYSALVCSSGNSTETEIQKLKFLLEKQVDGIILIPCESGGKHIASILDPDFPVVLMDRLCEDMDADAVVLNNHDVSEQATLRLMETCNHVAIITSEDVYTGIMRREGYFSAHRKTGRSPSPDYVKNGRYSVEGGYLRMHELWAQEDRPDGIFVTNYEMTVGVIMAVNELGIRIPEDLTIVGFDNVGMTQVINHNLLIVEQPMQEMAKAAAALLFRRMVEGASHRTERIELDAQVVSLEKCRI